MAVESSNLQSGDRTEAANPFAGYRGLSLPEVTQLAIKENLSVLRYRAAQASETVAGAVVQASRRVVQIGAHLFFLGMDASLEAFDPPPGISEEEFAASAKPTEPLTEDKRLRVE